MQVLVAGPTAGCPSFKTGYNIIGIQAPAT